MCVLASMQLHGVYKKAPKRSFATKRFFKTLWINICFKFLVRGGLFALHYQIIVKVNSFGN